MPSFIAFLRALHCANNISFIMMTSLKPSRQKSGRKRQNRGSHKNERQMHLTGIKFTATRKLFEITELEGFQGSCFPLITRVLVKGNVDTLPYNVDASRLKECNSCCDGERYETRSVMMNFENIPQDKVFLDHISYLFLNQFSAVIAENCGKKNNEV